jgi:hypothetical protein
MKFTTLLSTLGSNEGGDYDRGHVIKQTSLYNILIHEKLMFISLFLENRKIRTEYYRNKI